MEHNALLDPTITDNKNRKMEKMTQIELTGIVCQDTKPRAFVDASSIIIQSEDVETPFGTMQVAIQGDRTKTAIFTYHDIGLNHVTCFQGFFNYPDMQPILKHFCVYHLNAPGQEEGAMAIKPESTTDDSAKKVFLYPTMDELADAIQTVVDHFGVKRFIGFGVGSGSNILTRYALKYPNQVDSLCLVNANATKAGWMEWGYQKMNSWYLWSGQITGFTEEYLLWHWFGSRTRWENHDLVMVYRDCIRSINTQNLSLFIEEYLRRTDLDIVRELDSMKKAACRTVKCRSMLLVGDDSSHLDDVVEMNGRMDPEITDLFKIADCGGMPLEEQPGKVCEAFRLFLQGMGYVPSLRAPAGPVATRPAPQANVLSQLDTSSQPVC